MEPVSELKYGNNTVYVFQSAEDLQVAAADYITQTAISLAADFASFSISLSGGSTPIGVYQKLAMESWKDQFPWPQAMFLFGDERYVPETDEQSNYRMALDAFLGMGYVPRAVSDADTHIQIVVRGRPKEAVIVKRPFYKRGR